MWDSLSEGFSYVTDGIGNFADTIGLDGSFGYDGGGDSIWNNEFTSNVVDTTKMPSSMYDMYSKGIDDASNMSLAKDANLGILGKAATAVEDSTKDTGSWLDDLFGETGGFVSGLAAKAKDNPELTKGLFGLGLGTLQNEWAKDAQAKSLAAYNRQLEQARAFEEEESEKDRANRLALANINTAPANARIANTERFKANTSKSLAQVAPTINWR